MARHPFSTNPGYIQTIRGLHQIHALTLAGQDDSPEADAIRDRLDRPWYDLSEIEKQRIKGLSEDLYSISDPSQELLPSNPQVQRKLIEISEAKQIGKWDQALELLRRWSRYIDPALLAFLRGSVWQEAGDNATAVLFYEYASRQSPQFYKGVYLHNLKSTDAEAARKLASEVLDAEEGNPPELVVTAVGILFDSTRRKPAVEAQSSFERLIVTLERVLDRARDDEAHFSVLSNELRARAALLLAGCLERLGDSRAAIRQLNAAIAADPDNPVILVIRGILRYGVEAGAVDDFLKAIQFGSPNVWPNFYLAHHAFVAGRFEDCLKNCERGLSYPAPDEVRAILHEWLAIARAELGFPPAQVRSVFEEAIRLTPDSDHIRDNLTRFEKSSASPIGPRAEWVKPKASTIQAFGRPEAFGCSEYMPPLLPFPTAA